MSQKESGASRCQLSPYLVSCAVVPPSLGPGSLGPEFIDFARCCVKQGIVQLCRAEGAGVEGGGFWGLLHIGFHKNSVFSHTFTPTSSIPAPSRGPGV